MTEEQEKKELWIEMLITMGCLKILAVGGTLLIMMFLGQ